MKKEKTMAVREKLIELLREANEICHETACEYCDYKGIGDFKCGKHLRADHLIANDVVIQKHGRWVGIEYDGYADGYPVYDLWECSECGEEVRGEDVPDTHPWCHGCGAKMDGDT